MKVATLLLLFLSAGLAAAAPSVDDEREARARYERGMTEYGVREFDAAINDFKGAYQLTREPALLFNLGQASRLAKRSEEALYFYRAYLRQSPDAPNRRDAEEFIDRLAPIAGEVELPPPASQRNSMAPTTPPTTTTTETPARAQLERRGRLELGLGLGFSGAAIALLAGGIALGAAANHTADQVSGSATRGEPWSPQLRAQWDDGQRDAHWATALYVVGGASAVVGVVLSVVGARRGWRHFSAAPASGGAKTAWAF